MLSRFFPSRALEKRADALYAEIVRAARAPALYQDYGTPDTLDGRFEAIILHAHIALRRLRRADGDPALGQAVFDRMFHDFDRSLREMGVGDQGVPYRIKEMGRAAYGRFAAYDAALEAGEEAQREALARNFYATSPAAPEVTGRLAALQRRLDAAIGALSAQEIETRRPLFPAPETGTGTAIGTGA